MVRRYMPATYEEMEDFLSSLCLHCAHYDTCEILSKPWPEEWLIHHGHRSCLSFRSRHLPPPTKEPDHD